MFLLITIDDAHFVAFVTAIYHETVPLQNDLVARQCLKSERFIDKKKLLGALKFACPKEKLAKWPFRQLDVFQKFSAVDFVQGRVTADSFY